MNTAQTVQETSPIEKASYSVMGLSRGLSSNMISVYLMFFYTDVFEIPLLAVSFMLLIFKLWEGGSRQIVGFFMGNTKSRYGKYRPFILWTIPPFAVFSIAIFVTLDLSAPNKILYAYVTYFIWAVINNAYALSHRSLLPMISRNLLERTQINSYEIICSVSSFLIVSSFALKLVDFFGGGDQQKGFALTALGMAVIAMPLQFFAFKNIKERHPVVGESNISLKVAVRGAFGDPLLILLYLIYFMFWISCTFKNQAAIYYLKYVLNCPGFVGYFFFIGTIASLLMHFLMGRIIKRIKIGTAMYIGIAGSLCGVLIMYIAQSNIFLLCVGNFIFGLMSAIPANLIYIYITGFVDQKNNQYKVNLASWIYSCLDNSSKIAIGVSGWAFARLLFMIGYKPNMSQNLSAISGITFAFFAATAIAGLMCLILMILYNSLEHRIANNNATRA